MQMESQGLSKARSPEPHQQKVRYPRNKAIVEPNPNRDDCIIGTITLIGKQNVNRILSRSKGWLNPSGKTDTYSQKITYQSTADHAVTRSIS